ncbi:exocyst complex component exo84, partial [Cryomyces antarcticus]
MEEKSKGISLRKKKTVRPKISAPKQISGPVSTSASRSATQEEVPQALQVQNSASGLAVPRERPQVGGGKTSDLVKRRYSARYTSIPQDSVNGAPPVPTVPGFPAQYASQRPTPNSRQIDGPGEPKIQVDIQALKDPNLRPEQ